ncbi:interleukin-22 receptor subunit alpha-2 [Ochotona curzoniae]|uniref:interleukin-22 receptor subunit alpha-2 n=1 Tax=Ochotona curzoniae TaxID=130825 RepID=UPI001B348163|nr:interleukin-22 receptor subunit alpha-2 [Ochotona curzoniae]
MMPKHCSLGVLIHLFLTGVAESQPVHKPQKPRNVQFQSQNFHNILHWQPGSACPDNSSVYFVQYKIYGRYGWKNKEDCWGIQELSCDLTNETSDLQELYYGRVSTAWSGKLSDWSISPRFMPLWETKIDPPMVNITRINGSLLVILQAPNFPLRDQSGISVENYYQLKYRIFIINSLLEKEQKVYEGAQRVIEITTLTPRSSFCVVAETYQPMLDRQSHRSRKRCVGIL